MNILSDTPQDNSTFRFTQREQQVIQHLLLGKTSKEIARVLGITSRTVETYVNCLKAKLGCQRRGLLIIRLMRLGFGSKIVG